MTRSALCGAVWLALFFFGHELLQAQAAGPAAIPADLPDAPQPRQTALPCIPAMTHEDFSDEGESAPAVAALNIPGGNAESALAPPPPPDPQLPPEPVQGPEYQTQQNQKNSTRPGFPPVYPPASGRMPVPAGARAVIPHGRVECIPRASSAADGFMSCDPRENMYRRFLTYSQPVALTPKQKFILAYKNVRDPFNLLTVAGEAAISIASDSHSAYGPGFPGFGKDAGVSLSQDVTAEFLGTFLIPSLARQDPHYHRMPNLSVRRRIMHVIDAVAIAQGDDGQPMFNYAVIFGTIGTSALGNVYVPGREKSWGASTARISVALATDPIGNAITEFLPDVARRINVNVVLVQRVINRVAIEEGAGGAQ